MALGRRMIAATLASLLLVLGIALGLSRPVVSRMGLRPAEELVAGAALSLVLAFLLDGAVFASGAPLGAYLAVPVFSAIAVGLDRRRIAALLGDPDARELAVGQVLVSIWCIGLLAFIKNHSGGAWTGDGVEHWQRAQYFLRNWPAAEPFIGQYGLTARPPLANLVVAGLLRTVGDDVARFQLVSTALCSLAYLPVGLLAQRWGGRRAARVAALFVMLSPMFVQNATYPWTKLEAAFLILASVAFFLAMLDTPDAPLCRAAAVGTCVGGAVTAHYSAGPYAVVLALAWLGVAPRRLGGRGVAAASAVAAACAVVVAGAWFGWSLATFGVHGTFLSNTTVSMMDRATLGLPATMALNLRDTLIPPQVRGFHGRLFLQSSPWGSLRDQAFILYQLNLLMALGSVAWLAVVARGLRRGTPGGRLAWAAAAAGVIVLSLAAYADRDHYGIAHICLQALILLAVAFLAAEWAGLSAGWKRLLALGWAIDLALGIALQFAVEDFALDRWLTPGRNLLEVSATYSVVSQKNLAEKIIAQEAYFSDSLTVPPVLVVALLAGVLATALARALRTRTDASPS
jgi:hypothetical protein